MRRTETLASAYIGRKLEALRVSRGITAGGMARKIGMDANAYRWRETGLKAVTVGFLLRCHMVLGPDAMQRLWFPVEGRADALDCGTVQAQIEAWDELERPATYEQVIELCAEAFDVPAGALKGGLGHEKVKKARTAAAIVVASRPHLQLSELAPLVGRSRRALWWMRKQALEADSELLSRVEQIQQEVDAL